MNVRNWCDSLSFREKEVSGCSVEVAEISIEFSYSLMFEQFVRRIDRTMKNNPDDLRYTLTLTVKSFRIVNKRKFN